jgi:ABC-2 type transport system ATP-binding protein
MHDPELLILDEPTTGLDPLMQQEFFRIIDEARAAGRTVFLSSHVLPEVERLADRVGIVRQSRLVVVEEIETLKSRALRRIDILFDGPIDPAEFAALPGVRTAERANNGNGVALQVEGGSLDAVFHAAARHAVKDIVSREADLEELFLAYYAG